MLNHIYRINSALPCNSFCSMFAQRFALPKGTPRENWDNLNIYSIGNRTIKLKNSYVSMLVMMLYHEHNLIKNVLK